MDGLGKFRERVLDFTDGTLKKEPGGCEEDRSSKRLTILEDLSSPTQYGGIVRDAYSAFIGSSHSQVIERSWSVHPECSCCNHEKNG